VLHRSPDRSNPGWQSGLDWQPITRADLDDLDQLLVAIEQLDQPSERHTVAELSETFEAADADPGNDSILVRDPSGTLVGYGWNHPSTSDVDPRRVHLQGGIHPDWRRQGLGRLLLDWQIEASRQWYRTNWQDGFGPLRLIGYVNEDLDGQRRLYESAGLRPIRWYADMTMRFDGPLPVLATPAGVRIVPLTRDRFEAVRQAHNEAFADHWGSQPVDAVRWEEQLARSSFRLSWSWVALVEETSEVVGYATNSAYEQDWAEQGFSEGWTDRLGVRAAWRRRGVAQALLTASMRSFADAGMAAAGLGVDSDNPCRAFELYEGLGYRSTNTLVMYARTEEGEPAG
jgi:mycothiol synthase